MPVPTRNDKSPLLTQAQICAVVGVGQRELQRRWLSVVPIDAVVGSGGRKRYTLAALGAIVTGLLQRERESGRSGLDCDGDLFGEDSPALERYRTARAELAELDLEVRRAKLLDREKLENQWNAGAVALRNAGERLQMRFGDEAVSLYNEGVSDFARAVTDAINGSHDRGSPDDLPADVGKPRQPPDDPPAPDAPRVRRAGAGGPKRAVRRGKVQD